MNLVYGSSSSSYVDCMVFFGDECFIFRWSGVRITQCSYIGAFVVGLIIFGRYFCGSTSFRMSARRLPIILFVSRFEYPIISCYLLRGVPVGAGGGFYFVCMLWHVCNLRLIHGLLIILFLLSPPWALRRPHRSQLCYDYCLDISYFHSMTISCPSGLCLSGSLPLVTSQARLESDVLNPQPGVTAGFRRMFQALGGQDRYPTVPYNLPQ